MTVSARAGGAWNSTIDPSVNVGGEWKAANGIYTRQGGVWQPGWERIVEPFYPTEIPYSLFTRPSYGHLYRTPTVAGNRQQFSLSVWFKKTSSLDNGNSYTGLAATDWQNTGTESFALYYGPTAYPRLYCKFGGATVISSEPSGVPPVFIDTAQWFHVLFTYDTTITGDVKMLVNGYPYDFEWVFGYFPGAGVQTGWNGLNKIQLASYYNDSLEGYIADFIHTDGYILQLSDVAEFKGYTLVPKAYTGPYGAQGWHLKFNNSGNLGEDSSGNGNHFSNYSTVVQSTDTPTNNAPTICDWNRPRRTADMGGTQFNSAYTGVTATYGAPLTWAIPSKGTWYVEWVAQSAYQDRDNYLVGICTAAHLESGDIHGPGSWLYYSMDGNKHHDGVSEAYGAPFRYPATVQPVFNASTGELSFCVDGAPQGVAYTLPTDDTYFFYVADPSDTVANYTLLHAVDPSYPIAGANLIRTSTVPEPPLRDLGEMNHVRLFTGDGTTNRVFSGLKIDCTDRALIWIRGNSSPGRDSVFDSLRGAGKYIRFNSDEVEVTDMTTLSALATDGFTLSTNDRPFNYSNVDYVLRVLNMKPKYGMDMVLRSGNSQAGRAVSHGLNKPPELVLTKNLTTPLTNWRVGCTYLDATSPWNYYMELNTRVVPQLSAGAWNNTPPTASAYYVGDALEVNASGNDYIDYLFTSKPGLIKVGWYDGQRLEPIHTRFKTVLLLVTNITLDDNPFFVFDRWRDRLGAIRYGWNLSETYNPQSNYGQISFLSDRIVFNSTATEINAAGSRYIYLALSEAAAQYANGG